MALRAAQVPLPVHAPLHTHQDFTNKLIITQQTCLVQEKFSKNGVQKDVHVVVKNNPFMINLAFLDKQFNFKHFSTEIQLVYDCVTLKEVDFVKLKPLECKTRPNDEGDQLIVDIRIKVLTSQLEDMFFRVVIKLVDPRTRKEYFVCLSHPIRVVSKPDQVKKEKVKKKKRAPTDSLLDSINRIEHQQREQQRLLKRLCTGNGVLHATEESGQDVQEVSQPGKDDLKIAFSDFLTAFKYIQSVDTSDRINTNASDAQTMCEILELIRAEIKKERHNPADIDAPCSCLHCPYKEKMERIVSSMHSAVPDISISPCNTQTPPPLHTQGFDLQVHAAPVVSTEAIDLHINRAMMGSLGFDMNMLNYVSGGMSGGCNVFNNAFEFNPMDLFTPHAT